MIVELPESIINGRFKYSEKPSVAPGKCAVCGAVDKPVIDFGMDLDFYGAVLLCVECLRGALLVADLHEGKAQAAQVVPPIHFLDVEAVNEYVVRANASVGSLNTILATHSAYLESTEAPADRINELHERAESEDNKSNEAGDSTSFSEGPTSVSASISDGPKLPGFDL